MSGRIINPRVNIPPTIEQGDTVSWSDFPFVDAQGVALDATGYTLTYTIAGKAAPLSVQAAVQGTGWLSTLTSVQTGQLTPGQCWWQAQLQLNPPASPPVVITAARGELTVVPNLVGQSANYSGLSAAEQSLAAWQAALGALTGTTGPAVESYRIGEREMRYRNMPEILSVIAYWQSKVINEQTKNSIAQNQGNPRKRYARFPGRGPW